MKIGLVLPLFSGDAERVVATARRAEELGFDGVFAFDHLFPPEAGPERPSLEAFTTLAAVATSCPRLRLGTLVARAGARPAGLLAKEAAAVDSMSGGRFVLGLGAGDEASRGEDRMLGVERLDRNGRLELLEETVLAVRALLGSEPWSGGPRVPAMAGPLLPAPVASGGPPVWIGGRSEAIVRVAARIADGWNAWGLSSASFARRAALLAEEASAAGRAVEPTWAGVVLVGRDETELAALLEERERRSLPSRDEVWSGTVETLARFLLELAGAGATWAIVLPGAPTEGRLELIASEVLRAIRG